jgi:catechol 2,3-dioxygenase-like lactoylglutathione lyase family enzyme
MDWTLELVVVPVSDVDRAKAFYVDQLGFALDVDMTSGPDFRVVQLTPPGSACSIAIGTGLSETAPGTLHGLQLCVDDIEAAHRQLVEHGVDVTEPFYFGEAGRTPGLDPERRGYATFVSFHDLDGNTWLVQEVKRDWVVRQVKRDEAAA